MDISLNQGVAILTENAVEGCGNQGVALLAEMWLEGVATEV